MTRMARFSRLSRGENRYVTDSAQRKAENEARFRAANEKQEGAAEGILHGADHLVPFLCECADLSCTNVVQLRLSEYESVRATPTDGLAAKGHEDSTIEDVVLTTERFTQTRKRGAAGEAFARLDPRS
jgi:hypothetical protein